MTDKEKPQEKPKKKRGRGRPRKPGPNKGRGGAPKKMLTKARLEEIENLAKLGLTEKQIYEAIGIPRATFYKRKKDQAELKRILARGKAQGLISAAQVVRKKIEKNDLRAAMFLLRTRGGWNDREKPKQESDSPEEKAKKVREMMVTVNTQIHTTEKDEDDE